MGKKIASSKFLIPNSTFLIAVEPPQPPTAPAPAVRPTPPTPPRIDKTPFIREQGAGSREQEVDETPEVQARDAVAHGSGALTKRTVEREDDETPPNQTVTVIPPDAPLVQDTQSDYDCGQDVLREFKDLDARESQSAYNPPAQTSTEHERPIAPKLNHRDDGHGAPFWLFTAIFVIVATFVVAKKFLFTDKPQIFDDTHAKSKTTADKVKPSPPPPKPAKLPPKKDDGAGKHFEIRV